MGLFCCAFQRKKSRNRASRCVRLRVAGCSVARFTLWVACRGRSVAFVALGLRTPAGSAGVVFGSDGFGSWLCELPVSAFTSCCTAEGAGGAALGAVCAPAVSALARSVPGRARYQHFRWVV